MRHPLWKPLSLNNLIISLKKQYSSWSFRNFMKYFTKCKYINKQDSPYRETSFQSKKKKTSLFLNFRKEKSYFCF